MVNLRAILKENDLVGEVVTPILSNTPSRADIDGALTADGYTLPLPNKVSFHLFGLNGKMFLVTWFPTLDKYGYEKLTLK